MLNCIREGDFNRDPRRADALLTVSQVFMTRSDLQCIHEPFGDAFYYGPERLSSRFESDEKLRVASGFSESTYHSVIDKMDQSNVEV